MVADWKADAQCYELLKPERTWKRISGMVLSDLLRAGPEQVSSVHRHRGLDPDLPQVAPSIYRCSQCKNDTMVQGEPHWL
jgi:hypothetical protein